MGIAKENQVSAHLNIEGDSQIAFVGLDATARNNALSSHDWRHLVRILDSIAADNSVRMVCIRGAGGNFCAGSDLTGWLSADGPEIEHDFVLIEDALSRLERLSIPTIAIMDGFCLGAGLQLALACDIRIATDRLKWGMPILRLGIQPSPDFFRRIAEPSSVSFALDLFLSGEILDANEALHRGIATQIVEEEQLDETIQNYGFRLTRLDRRVIAATKRAARLFMAPEVSRAEGRWEYTQNGISSARIERALGRGKQQ